MRQKPFPLYSRLVVQQPSTWSPSSHILVAGRPTGPISYNYLFYFYIPTCPEALRWVRPAIRHNLPFPEPELRRPSPQQSGSCPQPAPDTMPVERIRRIASRKDSLAPWATATASSRQPAASVGPSNGICVRDACRATPCSDRASSTPTAHAADSPVGQKTTASSKWYCNERQTALPLPVGSAYPPSPHIVSRHRFPLVNILPARRATQWHRDGLTGPVHFCAAIKRRAMSV